MNTKLVPYSDAHYTVKFKHFKACLDRDLDCFFQYGVSLKAEPDHKTLGFRLKGAFKDVMKEIKLLDDDQLTNFIKTGSMKVIPFAAKEQNG